jgi:hypothetical protein
VLGTFGGFSLSGNTGLSGDGGEIIRGPDWSVPPHYTGSRGTIEAGM